jgi:hypothetical protein
VAVAAVVATAVVVIAGRVATDRSLSINKTGRKAGFFVHRISSEAS